MDLLDRLRANKVATAETGGQDVVTARDAEGKATAVEFAQPRDILKIGKIGDANADQTIQNHAGNLVDPSDQGFADAFDGALKAFNNGTATEEQVTFLERYAPVLGIKG